MIYDKNFLYKINNQRTKVLYSKITLLNLNEQPIESLEGFISQGSINVDSKSSVRRTCTLTMVSNNINFSSYLWSLHSKFKLEIGVENDVDLKYPSIIWFPQGIFVITKFSSQLSVNSYTISLEGKDKMCLLNGEVGGTFNSEIDFGNIEIIDTEKGTYSKEQVPLKNIIKEMVHAYGGEPFHNLIINDLDESGLELLEYRLKEPFYVWRKIQDSVFINGTIKPDEKVYIRDPNDPLKIVETIISDEEKITYDPLIRDTIGENLNNITKVSLDPQFKEEYYIAKINYGDVAGYRETEMVYPGDLIAKAGETITSVLDKIKKVLVFYEYYYNVDGQFVFGKIPERDSISYIFNDSNLISSFSSAPDLLNARNDFTVWGTRKTASGATVPIHMRKAIQKKPVYYAPIIFTKAEAEEYNKIHKTNFPPQEELPPYTTDKFDWRELIYQMAKDYRQYNHLDNFEFKISQRNPLLCNGFGKTGYEQYYVDMEGFWRQIYNPNPTEKEKNNFYDSSNTDPEIRYWNKEFLTHPENFNFFFDLLDAQGEILNFSNEQIGNRPKVVNNPAVKAISYREIPLIIFGAPLGKPKTGYRYFNIPNQLNAFSVSAQGKSAKDEIDFLLTEYSYCLENINLNAIPIYNLEPNSLIVIDDPAIKISGRYTVNRYSLNLNANSLLSLSATKKIDYIY